MMKPKCWIQGIGWVDYPVRVPRVQPVRWEDDPHRMMTEDGHIQVVWSGPEASRPLHPGMTRIPRALLLWVTLPRVYAQDRDYLAWLTRFYERQNDCVLWLSEVQPKASGNWVVRWKRWDR